MYAHVTAGAVDQTGPLPQSWTMADGSSVSGFDHLTAAQQAAEGWLPLTENRPAVTAQQTYGPPAFTVTATQVTADYPVVALPVTELNRQTVTTKAQQALAANVTFLALASPTAAQVAAQVKALTRQTNALLRLTLNALNDISDT